MVCLLLKYFYISFSLLVFIPNNNSKINDIFYSLYEELYNKNNKILYNSR